MADILPKRILIVDDDLRFLNSLSNTLQDEGFDVLAEHGGRAGIEAFKAALAQKNPFAVVITDLDMKEVDGRQVVLEVKTASPTTPVILITGWGEWFENNTGLPLPVEFVLDKPPKLAALVGAINQCLGPGKA